MKASPAAAVLGALVLSSCQGVTKTSADGGQCPIPTSVTADGFVEAYETTLCCQEARCDSWTSAGLDACRTTQSTQTFPGFYALAIAAGIDAGTLAIDTSHAVACLEALANASCSSDFGMPLECRAAMVGQPIGGACLSPFDCAEGSCTLGPSGCFGACTAQVPCSESSTCSVWETCGNGVCGPGAQAGQTCAQDDECAVGLVCGPRACVAPGPAGTPCTADEQCLPGTFCGAGSQRTCTPQLAPGAQCGEQRSTVACGFGSYCSNQVDFGSSGICVAYGDLGEPCLAVPDNSGFVTCLAGLYCGSDGVCDVPPESGPCALGYLCALGDFCDANQLCQPLRQAGDPCDEGVPEFGCASGECTSAFVCAPMPSICG